MKRTDIVALSRAAIQKLASNKVGVVRVTKKQLEKLTLQKMKTGENKTPAHVRKVS
jgi:hypothetical protein